MADPTGSSKKRKLPARYPREREIMVFCDMSELDYVLELLDELSERLSDMPDTITSNEWGNVCATYLAGLVEELSKAYVEYERFWQPEEWKPEDDAELIDALSDPGNLSGYVDELKRGRLVEHSSHARSYDPAQLACAQSLYLTLALMQIPGGKDWVEYCIGSLSKELTRYYAAALEVLLGRNVVFAGGRQKGAIAKSTKHIQELAKNNRSLSAKGLFAKADKSIIDDMSLGTFNNHVKDARKVYPKVKKPAD